MILKIDFWQRLDQDRELSIQSELVVDSQTETHDHGREFHDMLVAFSDGFAERANEADSKP